MTEGRRCIVLDVGRFTTNFGYSGEDTPRISLPTKRATPPPGVGDKAPVYMEMEEVGATLIG